MNNVYEFLLWNNCGNCCSFCHQRVYARENDSKILNNKQKIRSIGLCKDFLNSDQFENGNHILLVGGEIFDITDKDVKDEFMKLLLNIINKMNNKEINLFYINTNLLYEDLDLIYWFLDNIKSNDLFDRLKFTTSYDIEGRFRSWKSELLFYNNLKKITDKYPNIKIVVNTVLTKTACDTIINDKFGTKGLIDYIKNQGKEKFTVKEWIDYFRVQINTIPYIILKSDDSPEIPTRKDVFNALLHINNIIPGYLEWYAHNIGLKQEKFLYEYNKIDDKYVYCSSDMSSCGHSENFKQCFADSDKCYPCEIEKLAKTIKNK